MNINEYCQQCKLVVSGWLRSITPNYFVYSFHAQLINGLQLSIMQMQDISVGIEAHIDQIEANVMLRCNSENVSDGIAPNSNAQREKGVAFVDDGALPSIQMYFSRIYANKKSQRKCVNNLIESIGASLIKLEASILGTRTGQSPHMKLYYTFWENKLLKSLIGSVGTGSFASSFNKASC